MFHTRNFTAEKAIRKPQAWPRMQAELAERRMTQRLEDFSLSEEEYRPHNTRSSALALQQLQLRSARSLANRKERNAATGAVMQSGAIRLGQIARFESQAESETSLAASGQAHLSRARMLKEDALELNRMAYQTNNLSEAMFARNASQSSLNGAILEEVKGIASLEGRAGIAARTGLSDEKLDAFAEKTGIGSILSQHAAENTASEAAKEAAPAPAAAATRERASPADHWMKLEADLDPEAFQLQVFRFRAEQIKSLYGAPDAPPETKAAFNAMRKLHTEAHKEGLTSGRALRVNQKLVSDLPHGSEAWEAMVAIRGITLNKRKLARETSIGAQS